MLAYGLEALADLDINARNVERAATLLAAAAHLRAQIGQPHAPNERKARENAVAAVRAALGEEAFTATWAKGQSISLEQVLDFAVELE